MPKKKATRTSLFEETKLSMLRNKMRSQFRMKKTAFQGLLQIFLLPRKNQKALHQRIMVTFQKSPQQETHLKTKTLSPKLTKNLYLHVFVARNHIHSGNVIFSKEKLYQRKTNLLEKAKSVFIVLVPDTLLEIATSTRIENVELMDAWHITTDNFIQTERLHSIATRKNTRMK